MKNNRKNYRSLLIEVLGKKCAHCLNEVSEVDVDHEVPLCMNGEDTAKNLQVLCIPCHANKTSYDVSLRARARKSNKCEHRLTMNNYHRARKAGAVYWCPKCDGHLSVSLQRVYIKPFAYSHAHQI